MFSNKYVSSFVLSSIDYTRISQLQWLTTSSLRREGVLL